MRFDTFRSTTYLLGRNNSIKKCVFCTLLERQKVYEAASTYVNIILILDPVVQKNDRLVFISSVKFIERVRFWSLEMLHTSLCISIVSTSKYIY